MRNVLLILCLSAFSFFAQAQNQSYTFHIEDLKKPSQSLPLTSSEKIFTNIYNSYRNYNTGNNKFYNPIPSKFFVHSEMGDSLVNYGIHSFYEGMFHAYAEHRPFTLSPDMVWLLITQGFAQHVLNNAEKMRPLFVQHSGKVSLIVNSYKSNDLIDTSFWHKIMENFNTQIGNYTGQDLIKTLSPNFTTTSMATKVATQISIMESMKSYFEYVVVYVGCGIPDITLEGTPEDWEKVRKKANELRKYELNWWIDALDPILEQFVQASKHKVNISFWKEMFKYHEGNNYKPGFADGWIVKFFPYDKKGNRNNLKAIEGADQLPPEIVKVPLRYIEKKADGSSNESQLELWAGFVGLSQDFKSLNLKPEIAWMIRKSNEKDLDSDRIKSLKNNNGTINIRVKTFPKELLELEKINKLEIHFTDSVNILDSINRVDIGQLKMYGKCDSFLVQKINSLLPNTTWTIDNQSYDDLMKNLRITKEESLQSQIKTWEELQKNIGFSYTKTSTFEQVIAEKDYYNFNLSLPGYVQFENAYCMIKFSNGYYPHQGNLSDRMQKKSQEMQKIPIVFKKFHQHF